MKHRRPAWVYGTVLSSGGIMALFWPYQLSKEFRRASEVGIDPERMNSLAGAEKHYKYIAIFHVFFWPVMVFIGMAFGLTDKPELFGMVIRFGIFEVLLFFVLIIRLIYVFEKQFVDYGHQPKLWRTAVLTVLWFSSIRTMQKLTNLALERRSQA